jgi:hypothetical protein
VDFAVGTHVLAIGDPEVGMALRSVADRYAVIHLPRVAQDAEDVVVKLFGGVEIAAVDTEVIDHRHILACRGDPAVESIK